MILHWATLVAPSEPVCDACGLTVESSAAYVTYFNDEAGKAHGFRLVHRDAPCRAHATSVGTFVNRRSMSLTAFLSADTAGVWRDCIKRGSVRDSYELRTFLLRVHRFGYSIFS